MIPKRDREQRKIDWASCLAVKRSLGVRASFTVEAALLMTIILPVLISLIYASFYIHDRAVLQGMACEIASMGSNLAEEPKAENILNTKKEDLMKNRLLGTKMRRSAFVLSETQVSVNYEGSFAIPGMIMQLLRGGNLELKASWSRELYRPADLIRKIRGLHYMTESIKKE